MTPLNPHNNKGFHKLPTCLMENKDLPLSVVVVYSVMLSRYEMFKTEKKLYYDTYEQLAEHAKLSRATTAANVKVLIDLGLVTIQKVKSKSTLFNKNVWTVKSVFPSGGQHSTQSEKVVPKPAKDFGSFDLEPVDVNAELQMASVVQNLDDW